MSQPSTLDHIVVAIDDPRFVRTYEAVTGASPSQHPSPDGSASLWRFELGAAMIELAQPLGEPEAGIGRAIQRRLQASGPGFYLVCLPAPDLDATRAALEADGARLLEADGHVFVHPKSANGILVQLTPRIDLGGGGGSASARLDHVAVRVADLRSASSRWEKITGATAIQMGVHPISGGAFEAARLELGEQMVELISPLAGQSSAVADRLEKAGEGVQAVATPVADLEQTLARADEAGVRHVHNDPHWFVHPKDAGGFVLQLTDRIRH